MAEESEDIPKSHDVRVVTSPDFRRIVADRFYGITLDSMGLRTSIISEAVDIENVINTEEIKNEIPILVRTIECELVIKPQQVKALHVWLGHKVEEYEAMYGNIIPPEEVDKRAERYYKEKSKKNEELR
ncbi:hypothetical protein BH18THE1_BH18THE1_16860 [soil metagenome]